MGDRPSGCDNRPVPVPIAPGSRMRAALDQLAESLQAVAFALPGPRRDERRAMIRRTLRIIETYLDPRLRSEPPPLTVVIFGGTGSGKSTILNSLAETEVSPAGVLRPTTSVPVVWGSNPSSVKVPGGEEDEVGVVVGDQEASMGLALVDTPDVDSHLERHRALTEQLLDAADVAILVTTPQRYADASPRELIERLRQRRVPVVHVINRMRRGTGGTVADYATSLAGDDLLPAGGSSSILRIREHRLRNGLLPSAAVKGLRSRLGEIASSPDEVRHTVIGGTLDMVLAGAEQIAIEVERQHRESSRLVEVAERAYRAEVESMTGDVSRGSLVRLEVMERWKDLVGVSDLAAVIGGAAGRIAALLPGTARVRDAAARRVGGEVRRELAAGIVAAADRAASEASAAWSMDPHGRTLAEPPLRRAAPSTPAMAEHAVGDWMGSLRTMVAEAGTSRFRLARYASVGVNVVATLVLLAVLATGGLTGAEVGVVAGAAAAQQTILEHLLGKAAASRLVRRAAEELETTVATVLSADADRFREAVRSVTDPLERADGIRAAVAGVREKPGGGRG